MDYTQNKRIVILPYKMGSKSAKDLQQSLASEGFRTLRVYPDRKYRPRDNDFIINWGYSGNTEWNMDKISLNKPKCVKNAIDKRATFSILQQANINIPKFTFNKDEAVNWETIYTRADVCSSKGKGIAIFKKGDILPNVPLYVKGIDVIGEYRVHVMGGKVIDYAKKRQRRDVEYTEEDTLIRNFEHNWVFCRDNLRRLEDVEQIAIKSIEALGLDFGSVDIVKDNDYIPYVLEVNTASGIEGTTLKNYTQNIINLIK